MSDSTLASNGNNSTEEYYAQMEVERNFAEEAYFSAHPQLLATRTERVLFRAGFERAYSALWAKRHSPRTEVQFEPTRENLQKLVQRTADHWLNLQLTHPIAWEGAIDAAMEAACNEIRRHEFIKRSDSRIVEATETLEQRDDTANGWVPGGSWNVSKRESKGCTCQDLAGNPARDPFCPQHSTNEGEQRDVGLKATSLIDSAHAQRDEVLKRLVEANGMLRTCYQVVERRGVQTNWEALDKHLYELLERQRIFINAFNGYQDARYHE